VDGAGNVIVSDNYKHCIVIFSAEGGGGAEHWGVGQRRGPAAVPALRGMGTSDVIPFNDILKLIPKSWSKPRDSSNEEALNMPDE
jgi:hypothetical protein